MFAFGGKADMAYRSANPLNTLSDGSEMHEPAMALDKVVLSPRKEVVRTFYKDMWHHADKSLIRAPANGSRSVQQL